MRVVVQRVKEAGVRSGGREIARIQKGMLLLVGVEVDDEEGDALYLAEKVSGLRIFEDEAGKMNRDLHQIGGEALSVSQFTLLADCRQGRRPSFIQAARPEKANPLFERFNKLLEERDVRLKRGQFQLMCEVWLVNDGPVTFILDSRKRF